MAAAHSRCGVSRPLAHVSQRRMEGLTAVVKVNRCQSTYWNGFWRFKCERDEGHDGKHSGTSTGRRRDWTDEEAS